MKEIEMERIIELVTKQVLASLESSAAEQTADEGKARYLVVGDAEAVPGKLRAGAVLEALDAYTACANILRYQKVIITALDLVQLADIAQGRPGDAACCAVVQALLNGIDVIMLETAPVHRQYAGKGSTGLYALLESHVRTIQGFGVKLLTREKMVEPVEKPVRPAKYQAPAPEKVWGSAKPNARSLITESAALELAAKADGRVCLPPGTILTPSARDVFVRAGLVVERADS